jgi:hypothetical protein
MSEASAILAMTSLSGSAGPIGGAAAQKAAEAELRRAEYHRDDAGPLTRLLSWLNDRLDSLHTITPASATTWIVVLLLVGVVVFAILRAGRPSRLARAAGADDLLAATRSVDHRRVAADLQGQGRLAEALREWLRATVQTIEERGVLDARPGRTGTGIAREAGAAMPSIADRLNGAVDAFDAVWFGQRPVTMADVLLARSVADDIRGARIERPADVFGYAVPQ